jgi:hypothetical protein
VEAGEVAARYIAALKETGGQGDSGVLAAFRLTRKVGQELGDFLTHAAAQGWDAALKSRGLGDLTGQPREVLAQGLSAALGGSQGGLEAAVIRVSLTEVLRQYLPDPEGVRTQSSPYPGPDPPRMVQKFLAIALYQRLVLDLGEPLEAAGRSWGDLRLGLEGLQGWVEAAAPDRDRGPVPPPGQWSGLDGWLWVSALMGILLAGLGEAHRGGYSVKV